MKELITKYNMQPFFSDLITQRQIGWYLVSDHYIEELDALVDRKTRFRSLASRETLAPGFIRYILYI